MQYLVIHCITEKQKARLGNLLIVDKEYKASFIEEFEVPFELANGVSELRKMTIDDLTLVVGVIVEELSSKEQKAEASGVDFEPGMSLHEFLVKNKKIRTVNELTEYYDSATIMKAQRKGLFLVHKNKIVL